MSANPTPTRGRPPGRTRRKISISVPDKLAQAAAKMASKSNESLSQFISRAIQNELLNS